MEEIWNLLLGVLLSFYGGVWGNVTDSVPASVPTQESTSTAVVEYVIDGDTIILENQERVRLLGIDTPERGECYYEPATEFLRSWIQDNEVALVRDTRNRDTYGRLLRYVYTTVVPPHMSGQKQRLVNAELLKHGYAKVLPIGPDKRHRKAFARYEQTARAAARGRFASTSCTESSSRTE
jgi:micrococcal nuclease